MRLVRLEGWGVDVIRAGCGGLYAPLDPAGLCFDSRGEVGRARVSLTRGGRGDPGVVHCSPSRTIVWLTGHRGTRRCSVRLSFRRSFASVTVL